MIKERSNTSVEGNMAGEKVEMTFDAEAIVHLMGVMTDLYSDPELAVIREYSTNALDAHREAGIDRPIDVILPSSFSPILRIRDYGVGLNSEGIKTIYSKYGASTKRDTNEQTGMLGLGCKSALSYAPQFTLVGIKDGIRCQVSISRDERGAGSMTIVDEAPSTEPNGVEVIIACKRHNQIEHKAREFFKYWNPGTVLLNRKLPERIEGKWVSDKLVIVESSGGYASGTTNSIVVMGGVPYPVDMQEAPENYPYKRAYDRHLVAFVEIGDVNFPPSREALMYTQATQNTLKRIATKFNRDALAAMKRSIEAQPTKADAVVDAVEWMDMLPSGSGIIPRGGSWDLSYKGDKLPTALRFADDERHYSVLKPEHQIRTTSNTSYVLSQESKQGHWPIGRWKGTVWVKNFSPDKLSANHKKKLQKWVADNGLAGVSTYVLLDPKQQLGDVEPWLDPATICDYENDILPLKLPKQSGTARNPNHISGSYPGYVDGSRQSQIVADDIDTTKPVFWQRCHISNLYYLIAELDRSHPKGYTVVALSANRVDKFQRDFPNATEVGAEITRLGDAWFAGLSKNDKFALAVNGSAWQREYGMLDPAKVKDPELKRAIKLAKSDVSKLNTRMDELRQAGYDRPALPVFEPPARRYPLVVIGYDRGSSLDKKLEHVYLYVNAVYAAQQKGD